MYCQCINILDDNNNNTIIIDDISMYYCSHIMACSLGQGFSHFRITFKSLEVLSTNFNNSTQKWIVDYKDDFIEIQTQLVKNSWKLVMQMSAMLKST